MINKIITLILSIAVMIPDNRSFAADQTTQTPTVQAESSSNMVRTGKKTDFSGYDFEQVVTRVEASVNPLQQEMDGSLKVFAESVAEAQVLMEQGNSREAIQKCSAAMQAVLDSRNKVLEPMWGGQDYLNEQIGKVRVRLAEAIESTGGQTDVKLEKPTENMLNDIAKRISNEKDEKRQKRLVAHYKTVRQLAQIKLLAKQLSPNQKKLWRNVLGVLENTALTHQQVLMGTEILFAQFEATAANLKEYEALIDTVDGASRLLGVVKGLGESGQGLAQFSKNMMDLQAQMSAFNGQIEHLLEDKMVDLEAQAEAVASSIAEGDEQIFISTEMDKELQDRIAKNK